jgi:hypothetical protein
MCSSIGRGLQDLPCDHLQQLDLIRVEFV